MSQPEAITLKQIRDALASAGVSLSNDELKTLQLQKEVSLETKPLTVFAKLLTRAEETHKSESPKQVFSFENSRATMAGAKRKGKCRGLKVVKVSKSCAIYVNWPPSVSICCVFER